MKKLIIATVKRCLPLAFIFLFVFEFQRSFSRYPEIKITIEVGSVQDRLTQGVGVYDVLGSWGVLAYFTVLSNLIFVSVFFCSWTLKLKLPSWVLVASLVYMFITFLVFWTSIAPFLPWGKNSYYDFINVHEHFDVFLMCAVFYFHNKVSKLSLLKTYSLVMIFPFAYLLFTAILYASTSAAVYPFLDYGNYFALNLSKPLSVFLVVLSVIGIALLFFLCCYVLNNLEKMAKIKKLFETFSNH